MTPRTHSSRDAVTHPRRHQRRPFSPGNPAINSASPTSSRSELMTGAVNPDDFAEVPSPLVKPIGNARFTPKSTPLDALRSWLARQARYSPARLAIGIFALIIAMITGLLSLPFASVSNRPVPFVDTLFTAVSAVCVTGLTTVDTATYWTMFGQAVIALGIMIGGLGVMTLASILAFAVSRHVGLTQRMLAAQETKSDGLGQISGLLKAVIGTSLTAESVLFLVFLPRFLSLGETPLQAAWEAAFMSVSVFNNAGFVILVGGLYPHVSDWWMLMPIVFGTAIGAIGFPVIQDLAAHWKTPGKWALHTKLTLSIYFILAIVGASALALTEWTNPLTLGELDAPTKILNSLLAGVNSRSSGLSALDVSGMRSQTHFVQDILMMIGGGSASTAGGIKVTTFAVLVLAVIAEARGDRDIETFGRRIPPTLVRLSVAVTLLGFSLVSVSVLVLLSLTNYPLDSILFETISAFATVGLSAGISPTLPALGKYVLIALMFAGRTGTMTLAAALAMRERRRVIRMPEERPIIG